MFSYSMDMVHMLQRKSALKNTLLSPTRTQN